MAAVIALLSTTTIGATADAVAPNPRVGETSNRPIGRAPLDGDRASKPHRIHDDVADLVVRLIGNTCTGTPITGTNYVVTAAHCVLTETGDVTQRTIVRDDVTYPAVAVLVDTEYHEHPSAENDAAVLIMSEEIPGPSARVGSSLPTIGELTLAGFQPIDSDGSLLRGKDVNDHPRPRNASGTSDLLVYEPAACVTSATALKVYETHEMLPCGLIPGASGGGLYTKDAAGYVLVGILSSVTTDLKTNGIVPLQSLRELLAHPEKYAHGFTSESTHSAHRDRIDRS